jgi:hypothetical protein
MPPPLKIIITFVPYKLQSSYGASLKANEMLFSEIYNSHSDRVVLVPLSPDVTFDLQFLIKWTPSLTMQKLLTSTNIVVVLSIILICKHDN